MAISQNPAIDGLNWYAYCWDNPVNRTDPDGQFVMAIPLAYYAGSAAVTSLTTWYLLNAPTINQTITNLTEVVMKAAQAGMESTKKGVETGSKGSNSSSSNPNDPKRGNNLLNQTKEQLLKSKASFEKLINEHQEKLDNYIKNPDSYDNKGLLKNVSPELREKIIQGRIRELQNQIIKQQGELDKINQLIDELGA